VRLLVVEVLVAPHRDERHARERVCEELVERRDREGVAVEEEEEVVRRGFAGHGRSERVELLRVAEDAVLEALRGCEILRPVELARVPSRVYPLEVGPDAKRLLDVALEVPQLGVDPALVLPVDSGDVDHSAPLAVPISRTRKLCSHVRLN